MRANRRENACARAAAICHCFSDFWLSVVLLDAPIRAQMARTLLGLVIASVARGQATVNLQLSPPADPLPQVSAIVSAWEGARQRVQEKAEASLQEAYDIALADGRVRIRKALASSQASGMKSASAFLVTEQASQVAGPEAGDVLLEMVPPEAPSGLVRSRVQRLDRVLASEDEAVLRQGCREMGLLVDVVVGTLQQALRSEKKIQGGGGASFLASSDDVNVRIIATEPYPTIAELVADSERNRQMAGRNLKHMILQLELQLLQALNGFLTASLNGGK